jgi:uncharacterized protein YhfF
VDLAQLAHRGDGGEQAAGVLAQVGARGSSGRGPVVRRGGGGFKRPTLEMFERQSHPLYASARLWDDGIVDPRRTREVLALSLAASLNGPWGRRASACSGCEGTMTLEEALARHPGAVAFRFGDNETLCEELVALVAQGRKTATCGALRDFEAGGEPLPVAGRRDVALHWDGRPAVVIETVEVTRRRFRDVDEGFALAEGEDDSLEGWREGHRRFFERTGGWDPEMMLICERFRLVEVLG